MDSRISLRRASRVRFISSSTACVTCSRFSIIIGFGLRRKEVEEGKEEMEVEERKNRQRGSQPACFFLHILDFLYILNFLYFPPASARLFLPGRDTCRLPNGVAIAVLFVHDAEKFRDFPAWFQFKALGRIYPGLR